MNFKTQFESVLNYTLLWVVTVSTQTALFEQNLVNSVQSGIAGYKFNELCVK